MPLGLLFDDYHLVYVRSKGNNRKNWWKTVTFAVINGILWCPIINRNVKSGYVSMWFFSHYSLPIQDTVFLMNTSLRLVCSNSNQVFISFAIFHIFTFSINFGGLRKQSQFSDLNEIAINSKKRKQNFAKNFIPTAVYNASKQKKQRVTGYSN